MTLKYVLCGGKRKFNVISSCKVTWNLYWFGSFKDAIINSLLSWLTFFFQVTASQIVWGWFCFQCCTLNIDATLKQWVQYHSQWLTTLQPSGWHWRHAPPPGFRAAFPSFFVKLRRWLQEEKKNMKALPSFLANTSPTERSEMGRKDERGFIVFCEKG